MSLIELIRADAAELSDPSGKTQLDSQIEQWRPIDLSIVEKSLLDVVHLLNESDWKEWRAFRQVIWRLKIKGNELSNALAVFSEEGKPTAARARFYVYLARADLGNPASMDELLADRHLRDERPGDWLQLSIAQASPRALHGEFLKLSSKLSAADFTFILPQLREKYAEDFVEWMTELCRAMPFVEASELATLIDEDYRCGIYDELLRYHPGLKNKETVTEPVSGEGLWDGFPPEFRNRLTEKVQ
jgi:hypothetical protein